jgi:hypothetical protein
MAANLQSNNNAAAHNRSEPLLRKPLHNTWPIGLAKRRNENEGKKGRWTITPISHGHQIKRRGQVAKVAVPPV